MNGEISERKVRLMSAWFQRHESDLDSQQADDFLSGEGDMTWSGKKHGCCGEMETSQKKTE